MTTYALLAAGLILLGYMARSPEPARTDDEVLRRLVVASKLRQIEEQRAERFRAYDRAWSARLARTSCRPYVLPFAAGGSGR